jgi:hypothetical protein
MMRRMHLTSKHRISRVGASVVGIVETTACCIAVIHSILVDPLYFQGRADVVVLLQKQSSSKSCVGNSRVICVLQILPRETNLMSR